MKVREIGEQGLLERLQSYCPPEIIGDDGAVIITEPGQSLVVTTDLLVDGVHFSDATTSPEDAGWRAAAANLSDLAAMGASPLGITVGLGLSGDVSVSWVERLYQGMTQCLQKYNTAIAGGDIVRSPTVTLAITAFGQVDPLRTIRRNTAQVGNAIVVTGTHGGSSAGLELLLNPDIGQNLNEADKATLIRTHQRPHPRLDVLPILWNIVETRRQTLPFSTRGCANGDARGEQAGERVQRVGSNFASLQSKIRLEKLGGTETDTAHFSQNPKSKIPVAGMDSSDGLADAVLQICRASGVGAVLELAQIPLPKAFDSWLTKEQALKYALYGGEDFELVLCLPKELADELVQQLGTGAAIIGTITSGSTVILRDQNKEISDQVLTLSQGFQHFG
jgi:thiamine-monophosphate kinase